MGRLITVGEDCWIAGNVILLPGVTIGDGCTIGAGNVVSKVMLMLRIMTSMEFPASKTDNL